MLYVKNVILLVSISVLSNSLGGQMAPLEILYPSRHLESAALLAPFAVL